MPGISRKLRALDERAGADRKYDPRKLIWSLVATTALLLVAAVVLFLVGSTRAANLVLVMGAIAAINTAIRYGVYRVRGL